ncbi:hypothetical protein [Sutterella sp.]|uniref:hypothetical protein n=1 Tax=Sutterella sp. TaxID=1981025 RepID=UPI0026DFBF8C|nr:hypothetical protein [Sutterella sp.]MDO5533004.1 hypothetical protein [Sutterella sp.]
MSKQSKQPKQIQPSPQRPVLYNPKLVCAAALLFTPVFGAALQARNWTELGKPDQAISSRMWIRTSVWMIIMLVVMQTLFRNEPVMDWIGPYFLIVIWGAWMLLSGWRQLAYVNQTVGKDYESRPLGRPIMLGAFGWLFYMLITFTITVGLALTGIDPLPGQNQPASEESPGVILRIPEGSDKVVVEPLPPEAAQKPAP